MSAVKPAAYVALIEARLAEIRVAAAASWRGGRGEWISNTEVAAIEAIIAARLGGAS